MVAVGRLEIWRQVSSLERLLPLSLFELVAPVSDLLGQSRITEDSTLRCVVVFHWVFQLSTPNNGGFRALLGALCRRWRLLSAVFSLEFSHLIDGVYLKPAHRHFVGHGPWTLLAFVSLLMIRRGVGWAITYRLLFCIFRQGISCSWMWLHLWSVY